MKKSFIIGLYFLLSLNYLNAQSGPSKSKLLEAKGGVSGKVIEQETNVAIEYASVVLYENVANKVIEGGVTNLEGEFSFPRVTYGTYRLEISYIGYETVTREVTIDSGEKNLGTINLQFESAQLEGVEVTIERSTIEQRIDRKVINVGKDLTSAGATASEIFNNVPTLNVDQDGNVSMRGNENVKILIDGKPSNTDPAQLLRQIPSNSIDKIELITNPSAKYDPEGMSGILNIVLKKNANLGFNANLNTGLTYGRNLRYTLSI